MQKLLIALLAVMLVVTVVLGSLGIAYSKHDFVGTILTVEHGLGKVSNVCLSLFNKAKEFFLSGADLLGSIYDATIGKLIAWLEVKFDFSFIELFSDSFNYIVGIFKQTALIFDYCGEYGIHFLSNEWSRRTQLFLDCLFSESFYSDYDSKTGFLWDKFSKYCDAVIYGIENEFSYLLSSSSSFENYVSLVPCQSLLFGFTWSAFQKVTVDNADLWLTTISLDIPDGFCSYLPLNERINRYYSGVIPVFDSNFEYSFHDIDCELVGIKIYDSASYIRENNSLNGAYKFAFAIAGEKTLHSFAIEFVFAYYNAAGKYTEKIITFKEYMDSSGLSLYPNTVVLFDDVYIPE